MILEILGVIWEGFYGFIKGIIPAIPSIIELKDSIEKFTPMGMFKECLFVLGVPTLLIAVFIFVYKKFKEVL